MLLDFGAARRVAAEHSTTMTGLVKQGYSPQEQYTTDGRAQGPWTDIYALGATLYHAVAGAPPTESTSRMIDDTMVPAVELGGGYRPGFLAGIDAAMAVRPKDRVQSIADLREWLFEGAAAVAPQTRSRPTTNRSERGGSGNTATRATAISNSAVIATAASNTGVRIGVLAGVLVLALLGAYQLGGRRLTATVVPDPTAASNSTVKVDPPVKVVTAPREPERPFVVPDSGGAPGRVDPGRQAEPADDPLRKFQDAIDRIRQEPTDDTRREAELREAQRRAAEQREIEKREQERREQERQTADRTGPGEEAYREGLRHANGRGTVQDYGRARGHFETAAAAGRVEAMGWLGWLSLHGRGGPQDYPKAREWYEKAAAGGNGHAMGQLGWIHHSGFGVSKDVAKAREWYEKGAATGDPVSNYQLGIYYQNATGVAQDYAKARQYYEAAAAKGNASALNNLGWMYQNALGVAQDYVKAREFYEKAAAAGSASGWNNLGTIYEHGRGVPQDYVKARENYEKGAAGGVAFSYGNLGWLYQQGRGVPQDLARARELYEKAANDGNAVAMHNLALLYQNATGIPQDYAKAREWYEKGAAAGNNNSLNQLGWFYQNGFGVTKDLVRARQFYERGAAAGVSASMNQLGVFHQDGLGIAKDVVKARGWYEKAITAGRNGTAMWNLANLLSSGQGGAADYPRAAKLLLDAAQTGHEATLKDLGGSLVKWNKLTRTELKRELRRLGHYGGVVNEIWDDAARKGVEAYRAAVKKS